MKQLKLRRHQARAVEIAEEFVSGIRSFGDQKVTTFSIAPGCGKTKGALLFAHRLMSGGLVDQVLYICPRTNLVTQSVRAWDDGLGGSRVKLREARRKLPSLRGSVGYAITFQSLSNASFREDIRQFVGSKRTLVIVDEVHHAAEAADSGEMNAWAEAIRPLVDASAHSLVMSGTMGRHDGDEIPWLGDRPFDVVHSTSDGVADGSLVPVEIRRVDGVVMTRADGSASLSEGKSTSAVRLALSRDKYWARFLVCAAKEWLVHRHVAPKSGFIVMAPTQSIAHQAKVVLSNVGVESSVATSDSARAHDKIMAFCAGVGPRALVTVGMANEGMDAPHADFMVYLSAVRSEPWIRQSIGRVMRAYADRATGTTKRQSVVYVPDDPAMRDIVERISEEYVAFRKGTSRAASSRATAIRQAHAEFEGEAEMSTVSYTSFADGHLDGEKSEVVTWVRREFPRFRHLLAMESVAFANSLASVGFIPCAASAPLVYSKDADAAAYWIECKRQVEEDVVTEQLLRLNGFSLARNNGQAA